jgi:beta-glucosidase
MRQSLAPFLAAIAVSIGLPASVAAAQTVPADAPYRNPATPVEQRVADLLSRMTLEEKATMLSGSG